MNLILLIITLFFAVTPAYAHLHGYEERETPYNINPPDDIESFRAVDHREEYYGCSGYVRAGYIQTTEQKDHAAATAIGGELGCGYRLNQYIKAHLGVFASLDPGLNSNNDDNIQGDFFNSKKDSYLILGEAVLTLSYQQFEAHLGRQNFDSPHMDGDDLRMIANLFEAYLLDYHFSDDLYFGSGFVREASGWENGANASQFVSIGEAIGGKSSGAWVGWLNYQQQNLSSETWVYYVPDHLTILYSELIFSHEISDTLAYSFGFQYDWGNDTDESRLGQVDAHTFGVMGELSWADLSFAAAYNKNIGDTGAVASIGGGPFFTSVEDQTLDAVEGNDSESILLGFKYNIYDSIILGVAAAKFRASDKNDYNKEELNVFVNYNWNQTVAAELMYAVVDDLNSGPDLHQFRAILTYHY